MPSNYINLHEQIQKRVFYNISDYEALIVKLKDYDLKKIKPYFNNEVLNKIYHNFSQDDIYEVVYSYLSEKGKIQPSYFLTILAEHFGAVEKPSFYLNYFNQENITTEKEAQFFCFKLCLLSFSNQEQELEIQQLEEIYKNLQKEKPDLFSDKFVSKMLGHGLFYENIEQNSFQKKFIELNEESIKKFIIHNPDFILRKKQVKMIKFLLNIGFDDVFKKNTDVAQQMIIYYLKAGFQAQAKLINDLIPLDKEHLNIIIKHIEKKHEKSTIHHESTIYHSSKLEQFRTEYEKLHLEDTLLNVIKKDKIKMKI
jgi:hypothetical protein